jgi:hypothetical protein
MRVSVPVKGLGVARSLIDSQAVVDTVQSAYTIDRVTRGILSMV